MRFRSLALLALLPFGVAAQTIPPGYQGVVLTSIASGSVIETFNASVSPDIAVGDTVIAPLLTTPSGCVLIPKPDGNFDYQPVTVGDTTSACSTSRQSATITFYDVSAGALHADTLVWYDNNSVPVSANLPNSLVYRVPLNSPMTPVDLTGLCVDAEGDAMTYTAATALPTGLTITNNILQGTATSAGATIVSFKCTDVAGDSVEFQ